MSEAEGKYIPEEKESEKIPDFVEFYFMRHGATDYIEEFKEGSHEETGKWNPELDDLTDSGKEIVDASSQEIAEQIDPENQIVVMMSSPRARTTASGGILADRLKGRGAEFTTDYGKFAPFQIGQFLRSGGDFSPKYNEASGGDEEDRLNHGVDNKVWQERQKAATGWRIAEFLMAMSTFLPNYYKEGPPDHSPYKDKTPVFVLVTHNEVIADLIEKLNVYEFDHSVGAVPKGKYIKVSVDIKEPGHLVIESGNSADIKPLDIYIDYNKGELINPNGGKITLNKESVVNADSRALGG